LAEVYREQNKTDLAKRYYTKALDLDPANSWAKLALEVISKKG
jgi:Tfp pilus assembly protein PilF